MVGLPSFDELCAAHEALNDEVTQALSAAGEEPMTPELLTLWGEYELLKATVLMMPSPGDLDLEGEALARTIINGMMEKLRAMYRLVTGEEPQS